MEAMIKMDGHASELSPESVKEASASIIAVLKAGFDNHADQATIQKALGLLERALTPAPGISGTEISDSSFTNQPTRTFITADPDDIEDDEDSEQ